MCDFLSQNYFLLYVDRFYVPLLCLSASKRIRADTQYQTVTRRVTGRDKRSLKKCLCSTDANFHCPPPHPHTERMDSSHSTVQTATYWTVPFLFGLISYTVEIFLPCFYSTSNCINTAQQSIQSFFFLAQHLILICLLLKAKRLFVVHIKLSCR